jgi:cytidyltransferase-like protein
MPMLFVRLVTGRWIWRRKRQSRWKRRLRREKGSSCFSSFPSSFFPFQAKQLGDYLIVGVHSDEAILKNKGPTVMKEQERYKAVRACKWVDEVVEDAPYVTKLEWMDKYGADFCVHGDDLVEAADGTDCYHEVKVANRFKVVKRTKGVSTTDLVGRMLLLTKTHWVKKDKNGNYTLEPKKIEEFSDSGKFNKTKVSNFMATTNRLVQFSSGKEPKVCSFLSLFHLLNFPSELTVPSFPPSFYSSKAN